jgi:predicted nucleic acid-binding protein
MLLDTSIVSAFLRGATQKRSPKLWEFVANHLAVEGLAVAARLWAEGRSQKPALVFDDADLLVAATAAFHGHELATSDAKLVERLKRISLPVGVRLVPLE